MALSLVLEKSGFVAESLDAKAEVTMDTDKIEIIGSHLTLVAKVPNISQETFLECATAAKENCPISKALKIPISLDARLEQ